GPGGAAWVGPDLADGRQYLPAQVAAGLGGLGVEAEVPLGDVGQGEGAGALLGGPLGWARPVGPGPQRLGDRLADRPGHVGQGEPGGGAAAQHGQGQQRHQHGPGLGAAGPVHGTFHPDGPLRTVTYRLGILAPAASAMTRTSTSFAFTLRCWSGRALSAGAPLRGAARARPRRPRRRWWRAWP